MIVTVLKVGIPKSRPREIQYRNYSKLNEKVFHAELSHRLDQLGEISYENFEVNFLKILNKHAPLKTKIVRANHKPFITKNIRKAMMKTKNLQKNTGLIK